MKKNIDTDTVRSFGDEWRHFDQIKLDLIESSKIFEDYFKIFPWEKLPPNSEGFDMGCGTGRWAKIVSTRVGRLHCIEPSSAIEVAKKLLEDEKNIIFHNSSLDNCSLSLNSQDFGYSLGVLHHVPDTKEAIRVCSSYLKTGAPLLIYLYYKFENRNFLYKSIWLLSDLMRRVICKFPSSFKKMITDLIAVLVYFPLARLSLVAEKLGLNIRNIPLSYYRCHSFYTMRTDSRDRFGTPLEQRFNKNEIKSMMEEAGLVEIKFSEQAPFWCAIGIKK